MYYACVAMIQIRGVSDEAHRRLKARAALQGKSLSEYLRLEIEQFATLPTIDEMAERISGREPVGGESAAEAIRAERAAREKELDRRLRDR
jgi:plasmid stability protein